MRAGRPIRPESRAQSSRWEQLFSLLRHPLTTLCVGFIFTILIGGSIARHFDEQAEYKRTIESRTQTAKKLVESATDQLIGAKNLIHAMRNKETKKSISEKRELYEATKSTWWKESFLIDYTANKTAPNAKSAVDITNIIQGSVADAFDALDECLAKTFPIKNPTMQNKQLDDCKRYSKGANDWKRTHNNSVDSRVRIVERCIMEMQRTIYQISKEKPDESDTWKLTGFNYNNCTPYKDTSELRDEDEDEEDKNKENTSIIIKRFIREALQNHTPPHFAH